MSDAPEKTALIDLESRPDADCDFGEDGKIAWGSRSDVGLIREHNEDSYLCRPPLFAVSDGMGGEEAGEVASSIAIHTLAKQAPETADASALAKAVEAANLAVLKAPEAGRGTAGMGCTLTACILENNKLACAHVGDSRIYLLHNGIVVRVTHDHSYVEELVDQGAITADEARVHPKRSVLTRALGSDQDMYADHFTLDVEKGERIVICSDGLSSMIGDAQIEDLCINSKKPQDCADALVSAALVAGGKDNVTVVVIDVLDDGVQETKKKRAKRTFAVWASVICLTLAALIGVGAFFYSTSYYIAPYGDSVGIYRGFPGNFAGFGLSQMVENTDIALQDLTPEFQAKVESNVAVPSQADAHKTIESYKKDSDEQKQATVEAAEENETAEQPGNTPDDSLSGDSQDQGGDFSQQTNPEASFLAEPNQDAEGGDGK